jgi:hypothetical protein
MDDHLAEPGRRQGSVACFVRYIGSQPHPCRRPKPNVHVTSRKVTGISWPHGTCIDFDVGWLISLFGLAIRNSLESKPDFLAERRFLLVSFRLPAFLRNVGRYFAAGDTNVGFGPRNHGKESLRPSTWDRWASKSMRCCEMLRKNDGAQAELGAMFADEPMYWALGPRTRTT